MSSVVLLRAANVGGHQRFLPSAFVAIPELAKFRLVNLGAAGTFVARCKVSDSRLRRAIASHLLFETDISICAGDEILQLLRRDTFRTIPPGAKPYLTVLGADPTRAPTLPFSVPSGPNWEVNLVSAHGRYVLSWARRWAGHTTYPNPVVEREYGVAATTRGWPTVVALGKILETS
ncbi:MAG: hypothetical protein L3K02_00680 [Thermoplasmata archaeon]|nr:hypothetical protein [Thermoplasmata archaeon]